MLVSICICRYKRWRFSRKLKIELLYDAAILLWDIYPDKTVIQKDTLTFMFIAAIFRIAKTWKQSKCPSSDDWLENGFLIEQPLESCPDTPLSEHCWLVKHTAEPQGWAP